MKESLRSTVGELADKVDETFFIERSPFTTWNRTPAGVLHKLSDSWRTHLGDGRCLFGRRLFVDSSRW